MRTISCIVVSTLFLVGCEEEPQPCEDFQSAYQAVQSSVKQRLKAPATAIFPEIGKDRLKSTSVIMPKDGECGFAVSAYVDSQNAFGALLRTNFSAKVHRQNDQWVVSKLLTASN